MNELPAGRASRQLLGSPNPVFIHMENGHVIAINTGNLGYRDEDEEATGLSTCPATPQLMIMLPTMDLLRSSLA